MKRAVLACIFALITVHGIAQTAKPKADAAYYVILDTRTKRCSVVDKTPQVDSANITVATDAIYTTTPEAEKALLPLKPCAGTTGAK